MTGNARAIAEGEELTDNTQWTKLTQALHLEDNAEDLRYEKGILATDADVGQARQGCFSWLFQKCGSPAVRDAFALTS